MLAPVAVGAALALWSIGFGLPYLFRPDEDVMVGRAVRMAAEGSLDPLFQNYPPLVFEIFALIEKAASVAGAPTLVDPRHGDPSAAYLAARLVSAACAAATVGLTSLAARAAYGPRAAIAAGLTLALAPLAVRQAHFATTDYVQAALATAALAAGVRARGPRGFALAGALAGLAAAAKYTGGLALVPVLALAWPAGRRAAAAALAGSAVAFAVPGLVMLAHPTAYLQGIAFLGGRGYATAYGFVGVGIGFYPLIGLPLGLGVGVYGLALAGAVRALRGRRPPDVALLLYLASFLAVTAPSREVFLRYALPVLPALAILAGRGLLCLPSPAAAAGVLLLIPSAWVSVQTDVLLGTPDTRVLAAHWLEANVPAGAAIACPYYVCPFYSDRQVAENHRFVADDRAAAFLQGRYSSRWDIEGPNPVVRVVATGPRPFGGPAPPPGVPVARFDAYSGDPLYDPLDAFFVPIWGLWEVQRPGPQLTIIRP